MTTQPIESILVRFRDGRVKKVTVGKGEGFYREEHFSGSKKSFTTIDCFVTEGIVTDIPSFKKERQTNE